MGNGEVRADYGMSGITLYGYTFQQVVADSGLMDYKARAYDPFLQKFIQPDTVVAEPGSSQGYNRYVYVNNDPVNHTDPSGNKACEEEYGCPGKMPNYPQSSITSSNSPSTSSNPTVFEQVEQGDWNAILKLITPTHIGVRAEAFICVGFCLGIGGNFIHNFYDKRTAISADYSGGVGPSIGSSFMPKIGIFASVGLLVGWASSSIMDSTSGDSQQLNGFAAAEEGITASVNTPINLYGNGNLFRGDPYYGQSPVTMYLGFGAGIGLGAGTGISHTFAREDIKW